MSVNIFAEEGFWENLWNSIVNFFTVTLPGFFMNYEENWVWFIVIGAGLIALVVLIIILARIGKKRRRAKRERRAAAVVSAEAAEKDNESAAEELRRQREEQVRAEQETLLEQRIAEEERFSVFAREEEERRLQEAFAQQAKEGETSVADQPATDTFVQFLNNENAAAQAAAVSAEAEVKAEDNAQSVAEEVKPAEEEIPAEEKPAAAAKKPAAKPASQAAKKSAGTKADEDEKTPPDIVKYSIVYDRVTREWVVRKSGAERAIRRLHTKAEALEYAEQLSARQGLALQVHKKDGKFQKQ